jgi:hypothetical protein
MWLRSEEVELQPDPQILKDALLSKWTQGFNVELSACPGP